MWLSIGIGGFTVNRAAPSGPTKRLCRLAGQRCRSAKTSRSPRKPRRTRALTGAFALLMVRHAWQAAQILWAAALVFRPGWMDCHEDQELAASASQSPSQQPRRQEARAALRHQQDQPPLQGPPGVIPMGLRQSFGLKRIGALRPSGMAGGLGLAALLLAGLISFGFGTRLHAAPLPVQPGTDAIFP